MIGHFYVQRVYFSRGGVAMQTGAIVYAVRNVNTTYVLQELLFAIDDRDSVDVRTSSGYAVAFIAGYMQQIVISVECPLQCLPLG